MLLHPVQQCTELHQSGSETVISEHHDVRPRALHYRLGCEAIYTHCDKNRNELPPSYLGKYKTCVDDTADILAILAAIQEHMEKSTWSYLNQRRFLQISY